MLAPTTKETLNPLSLNALRYADRGWPVFPTLPGAKRPATPRHAANDCDQTDPKCRSGHTGWAERATVEHQRIVDCWENGNYGIGIACGAANLLVVDLDAAKNGEPSGAMTLGDIEDKHGQRLPDTYTVATPSGGYHLYYSQPADAWLANTAAKLGPGLDTRGHGGYVLAPPTRLTGRKYPYTLLQNLPVVELPQWFSKLLTSSRPKPAEPSAQNTARSAESVPPTPGLSRYVASAITLQLDQLAQAPVGQRNHTLFITAVALGQLVGAGATTETGVTQQIRNTAASHVEAGAFSWTEADRTIQSGLNKGIKQPRQLPTHLIQ